MPDYSENLQMSFDFILNLYVSEIETALQQVSGYGSTTIPIYDDIENASGPACLCVTYMEDEIHDEELMKTGIMAQLEVWTEYPGPPVANRFVNRFIRTQLFDKLGLSVDRAQARGYIPYKNFVVDLDAPNQTGEAIVQKSTQNGWKRSFLVPNQSVIRTITTLDILY